MILVLLVGILYILGAYITYRTYDPQQANPSLVAMIWPLAVGFVLILDLSGKISWDDFGDSGNGKA